MDFVSVIASITGIVAAGVKISTIVSVFVDRNRDAPSSMRSALAEISDLNSCLAQLLPFVQGVKEVAMARRNAVQMEQLVIIFTSLIIDVSELEKTLDSCRIKESTSKMARIRWMMNEERINKTINRVQASKNSLNLILTIFTW